MRESVEKLSASLRSQARNERFWIELNTIKRNSRSDLIHGAIQLCAALPVGQKAKIIHNLSRHFLAHYPKIRPPDFPDSHRPFKPPNHPPHHSPTYTRLTC